MFGLVWSSRLWFGRVWCGVVWYGRMAVAL
ncbi:hypothetical protein [Escherichia phage L27]|uniref:Uncharacterized protein n=1 Tax=Escherichia phage L27 TaxID=2562890 RepID=A0A455XBN8_9CAUD|nr:hypothetical protein [Escherichia phage L27]